MEFIYKTKNNNYLIEDTESYSRFVNSELDHLRWVHPDELLFLRHVCEPVDVILVPEPKDPPVNKVTWEIVVPPEYPELSNNGGSYAYLHRVELWSGWDTESFNGYYIVTNHLYGSDYSDQGWHYEPATELEAMRYIEKCITVQPSK